VKLDANGGLPCLQFPVSTVFNEVDSRNRPGGERNIAMAFQDYRCGNFPSGSAIFVQNVNSDCTLGNQDRVPVR